MGLEMVLRTFKAITLAAKTIVQFSGFNEKLLAFSMNLTFSQAVKTFFFVT